jgi:D-alanyl-D-alanine carboxypeptidase
LLDYPGVDGIKTGYIRASGYNLVISVRRDGRQIIGIIFGGNTASQRDHEMRILLDSGFARLGVGDSLAQVTDEDKDIVAASFDVHNLRSPLNLVSQSGTGALPTLDQHYTWRLQVGAFSRYNTAKQQISRAIEAVPDRLSQARAVIVPLVKSGRTLYRAYFKDLSEEEAGTACQRLRHKRIDCLILPPSI